MPTRDEQNLLLSDTSVSDLFIADHMPLLDEYALKVYLLILQGRRRGENAPDRQSLAVRLGISSAKLEKSLNILTAQGLLERDADTLRPVDLKLAEVRRFAAHRQPEAAAPPAEVSKRERVVAIINDTYFQGTMSYRWYQLIDTWFDRYGFKPEVVYTLFSELVERNKLNHAGYAASIADNWHRSGVKTFEQLSMHQDTFKANYAFCAKVARSLRIQLDEYNEPLIRSWQDELGFDFDIVELALKQSVRMSNAKNLTIYDRMLRTWHEAGLKDKAAVEAFEASRRAKASASRQTGRPGARDNRGNYADQGDASAYADDLSDGLRPLRLKQEEQAT